MNDKVLITEPHWYRQYIGECPLCGKDQGWKERVAGEKPDNDLVRYLGYDETYCGCS